MLDSIGEVRDRLYDELEAVRLRNIRSCCQSKIPSYNSAEHADEATGKPIAPCLVNLARSRYSLLREQLTRRA